MGRGQGSEMREVRISKRVGKSATPEEGEEKEVKDERAKSESLLSLPVC